MPRAALIHTLTSASLSNHRQAFRHVSSQICTNTFLIAHVGSSKIDLESQRLLDMAGSLHMTDKDKILKELRTDMDQGLSDSVRTKLLANDETNYIEPPLPCPAWLCCLLPCLKNTELMSLHRENVPLDATVKMDGAWIPVDASGLVRGDIVQIRDGEIIPADLVILECSADFEMDRSILGGSPNLKGSSEPSQESILAANNTALLGSRVNRGTATCVTINVGNYTEWVKMKYPDRKNK